MKEEAVTAWVLICGGIQFAAFLVVAGWAAGDGLVLASQISPFVTLAIACATFLASVGAAMGLAVLMVLGFAHLASRRQSESISKQEWKRR